VCSKEPTEHSHKHRSEHSEQLTNKGLPKSTKFKSCFNKVGLQQKVLNISLHINAKSRQKAIAKVDRLLAI